MGKLQVIFKTLHVKNELKKKPLLEIFLLYHMFYNKISNKLIIKRSKICQSIKY